MVTRNLILLEGGWYRSPRTVNIFLQFAHIWIEVLAMKIGVKYEIETKSCFPVIISFNLLESTERSTNRLTDRHDLLS